MSEISDKQLEANRQNAKLGGVKTPEGKAISSLNAVKHSILTNILTEDEAKDAAVVQARLTKEYDPQSLIEEVLIERITVWYVRLQRAVKAESEQIKQIQDPRVTEEVHLLPLLTETKIIREGYKPKIVESQVEGLSKTYLRYETTIERNFYKALHELQRVQATRNGGVVPPPLAIDVDFEDGQNGFVSQ